MGRKSMIILPIIALIIFSIAVSIQPVQAGEGVDVRGITEKEFIDPPLSARPGAFWPWLDGDVSLPQLTRELEEMKAKGMSGAEIWDVGAVHNPDDYIPAGPAFFSPLSVKAMHHAIKEGTRLGLRMGMVTSSGWNAGGSWVRPRNASKGLYISKLTVKGPEYFSENLPFPQIPEECPKRRDGLPRYYEDIAVLAFPKSDYKIINNITDIINLSSILEENGRLSWNVPSGEWIIMRFVCTNTGQHLIIPSPNSDGLFIDFLDPEATRMHMEYIINKLLQKLGTFEGSAFGYLEVDSMELHQAIPWTGRFIQEFIERRGYDPTNYLPVLDGWKVIDKDISERFIYDQKLTVSDLLIFSHYTTGSKVLNEHGLELVAEAGGPGPPIWDSCPVDALKALGQVDIPRGEFWIRHRNMFLIKEISSAAHIYGKKLVDAESFTTWRRWMDSPFELKRIADRAFCEGLNHITFHTFSHNPPESGFPGRAYHAGVDFNTGITWWNQAEPFVSYLSRCCYMLQKGLFVGDVCYYYGDEAPNFYPKFHDVPVKPVGPSLGWGYDYDVVNTEVILTRMESENGRIVLPDGMSYRVLVLPDRKDIPLEVLKKLEQMVSAGVTVIGPKPERSAGLTNYPKNDHEVKKIADRLWGPCDGKSIKEHTFGNGKIIWGRSVREVLQQNGIGPDFSYPDKNRTTDLDYIHRRTESDDIYFVRNKNKTWEEVDCVFRVTGKKPELWLPESAEIKRDLLYDFVEGGTRVTLRLPPGGSVFVVFKDQADNQRLTKIKKIRY